jgi:peptidoglycan DL-endopeptidase CwlO
MPPERGPGAGAFAPSATRRAAQAAVFLQRLAGRGRWEARPRSSGQGSIRSAACRLSAPAEPVRNHRDAWDGDVLQDPHGAMRMGNAGRHDHHYRIERGGDHRLPMLVRQVQHQPFGSRSCLFNNSDRGHGAVAYGGYECAHARGQRYRWGSRAIEPFACRVPCDNLVAESEPGRAAPRAVEIQKANLRASAPDRCQVHGYGCHACPRYACHGHRAAARTREGPIQTGPDVCDQPLRAGRVKDHAFARIGFIEDNHVCVGPFDLGKADCPRLGSSIEGLGDEQAEGRILDGYRDRGICHRVSIGNRWPRSCGRHHHRLSEADPFLDIGGTGGRPASQARVEQMPTPPRRGALLKIACAAVVAGSLAIFNLSTSVPSMAAPSQSQLADAKARLNQLEADFELAVEHYDAVHQRLTLIRSEMARTEVVVTHIRKRIKSRMGTAVALARELYMSGQAGALEAVLSSTDLSEIESRLHYLQSSEQQQTQVFERLAVDRQTLNQKLGELSAARAKAAADQGQLAQLKTSIQAKVASQEGTIARLNREIAAAARRAAARARAQRIAQQQANQAAALAAQRASAAATAAPAVASTPSTPSGPAPPASARAQIAVRAALSQVGKPYQWGAAGPNSYDCSGLTMWAWAHAGVSLSHSAAMQYNETRRVATGALQPGDLLFYGSPIHHVAMYIGGGQLVEAPYTGALVRVASTGGRPDYVGAGRPGV